MENSSLYNTATYPKPIDIKTHHDRIPQVDEYLVIMTDKINPFADYLDRYLNLNRIQGFEGEDRIISAISIALLDPIDIAKTNTITQKSNLDIEHLTRDFQDRQIAR